MYIYICIYTCICIHIHTEIYVCICSMYLYMYKVIHKTRPIAQQHFLLTIGNCVKNLLYFYEQLFQLCMITFNHT